MKFNEYDLIERAVEEGVLRGIRKWSKYDNQPPLPSEEADIHRLSTHLAAFVMDSMHEICYFENGNESL